MGLVERAATAGFDTLLVTVDVPVAGLRVDGVRARLYAGSYTQGRTLEAVALAATWSQSAVT